MGGQEEAGAQAVASGDVVSPPALVAPTSDTEAQPAVPDTVQTHSYDWTGFAPNEQSATAFNSFGAAMAKTGASQEQAGAAVQWLREFSATENARLETSDAESKRAAHAALREAYPGTEFGQTTAAIESYLRQQPAVVQDALRHLVAYDAEGVKWLAKLARSPTIPKTEGGKFMPNERGEIEQLMRENRREYNRNPGIQAKYRDLIAADEGNAQPAAVPADAGAIEAEIGKIHELMRDRRGPYWRGPRAEKLQDRLRTLYRARGAQDG